MKPPRNSSWKRIVACSVFVLLRCSGLGQQPVNPQTNLFVNGSFEKGLDGWEILYFGEPRKGAVTIDTKVTHNGHPSVRIDHADARDTALVQEVTFKTHTRYQVTGWIKAKNVVKSKLPGTAEGKFGAMLCLTGGFRMTDYVVDTDEWQHVSLDLSFDSFKDPVKDSHRKIGPQFGFYKKWVSGTAWFADISLVELGSDNSVVAVPSAPVAPPPKPPTSDAATLGSLVKANHGSLVFVNGTNGAGSGFIASMGVANYLFTNAHVAAGVKGAAFKTLDGAAVSADAPSVAVDHDIFRMTVPAGGKPLELMEHVDANAAIGDEIVVLGNAEGAGVITPIKGTIVGIGPNLIEVDAPFVPGNSGSPIIHLKTGKVIAVATYAVIRKYDTMTKEPVKEPVIRRFGYRLDSVKSWQPVNWNAFAAEAAEMANIEKLTKDLGKLLSDIAANHKITPGLHNNPAIKLPIDLWFADRERKLSPSDRAMSEQNFVSRLKSACQDDVTAARPRMAYDYFQRALADQQRERAEIAGAFDGMFQNLRKEK
jgi:hypothetical protein